MPRQPQFDTYLKVSRGINPDQFAEQQARDGFFIPNLAHYKQPSKVDPMRVSQTVQKNMMNAGGFDVELKSKDQELIFSKEIDEELSPTKVKEEKEHTPQETIDNTQMETLKNDDIPMFKK